MFVDYVDKLQLTEDYAKNHGNELNSLRHLTSGLWFLNEQISKIETQVAAMPNGKRVFHFCNSPDLEGIPQDLVACAFHWYAVTACKHVKMIGWLANSGDSNKAREYMEKVLPAVHLWRHKVGAHFAIIDPRKDDNAADLAMSVIFPVSYDNDAFYTGSLTLTMSAGGKQSTNRQDMRWSLTQIHKELISRYWPPSS